jgi:hypothetical protein
LPGDDKLQTLAQLANSERLGGNLDTAIKLGIHAAGLGLSMDTALATVDWHSDLLPTER